MTSDLYLGYRNDDSNTPFGTFFRPEMGPLSRHVVEAPQHGSQGGMALATLPRLRRRRRRGISAD